MFHNVPTIKKEIEPALEKLDQLPAELGKVANKLADTGYFSEANAEKCEQKGIAPYIANKRTKHNTFLKEHVAQKERSAEQDPKTNNQQTAVERMIDRMKTPEGKKLYAKRKSTIEPAFGIIKHVMGFRQFMLRGVVAVSGEWNLVCTAFNIKRLHRCSVGILQN